MSCWGTQESVLCHDSYLRSAINCKDHLMMIMMIMMMTNLTSNMCPLYHHHGSWSLIFSPVVHSVFSIVLLTLFYHLTSPRLVSDGSVRSSLQVISQREISTLELCFSCSTIFLYKNSGNSDHQCIFPHQHIFLLDHTEILNYHLRNVSVAW